MNGTIYLIYNLYTKRNYVGATRHYHRRRDKHLRDLRYRKHHNRYLQDDYDMYGKPSIKIIPIDTDIPSVEILDRLEIYYTDEFNSMIENGGYNIRQPGGNPTTDSCKLRSVTLTGRTLTQEHKSNIRKSRCNMVKNIASGKVYKSESEASKYSNDSQPAIWNHCNGKVKQPRWTYLY